MPAFDELMAREAGPDVMGCQRCGNEGACNSARRAMYRCNECFQLGPCCAACLTACHAHAPFHRAEMWTEEEGFWRRMDLCELGLEINLGHVGERCPVAVRDPRRMTVVHDHGVCCSRVRFCECIGLGSGTATPECLQLIQYGLFGASWDKPKTAFTIQSLKIFHLLSLQSQLTAHDFVGYLKRATDNVGAAAVAVSFRS